MRLEAIDPLSEDFFSRWSQWYPAASPVGFLLRAAYPERWFRIHSLPGSKRYPTSPEEQEELLNRHRTAATDLLGGEGARCAILVRAACDESESRDLGSRAALADGDLPFVCRLPSARLQVDGEVCAEPVCLFGGISVWRSEAFDGFIRAVASESAVAGESAVGLVVDLEHGHLYAPYDGGTDTFVATGAESNAFLVRYQDWLSPRPDRL